MCIHTEDIYTNHAAITFPHDYATRTSVLCSTNRGEIVTRSSDGAASLFTSSHSTVTSKPKGAITLDAPVTGTGTAVTTQAPPTANFTTPLSTSQPAMDRHSDTLPSSSVCAMNVPRAEPHDGTCTDVTMHDDGSVSMVSGDTLPSP